MHNITNAFPSIDASALDNITGGKSPPLPGPGQRLGDWPWIGRRLPDEASARDDHREAHGRDVSTR